MNLTIAARKEGTVVVVAPEGRIDQAGAAQFQAALAAPLAACRAGSHPVVLDFSGVSYISSVGLRVLMLAFRQAAAQQCKLSIAAPTPVVRDVFEIGRFDLVFGIFDSVADAMAAATG